MKMSLFQGILLGAFGLAGIIGVFVFASFQGGSSTEDAIGTVVIWGALPKSQIDSALTLARQENQALKGVSYMQKNTYTLRSDLINAIAEGQAPDMVLISQEDLLGISKVLQVIPSTSLSERSFKDAFVTGGEVYLAPGGAGTYGVPFLVDPLVLFTNRTILASSGIASAPTTWEAITGLVPRVATRTASGNIGRALIALGTYANVHNARGILSALFLQTGIPISTVASGGFRKADLGTTRAKGEPQGTAVLRFYTQFADPAKVSYTWNASLPDSQTHFVNGDLALYAGYASEAGYFAQANPNLDFDVAPLPQLAASGAKSTYGLVYAFTIPRSSKNPSGAYSAAIALTNFSTNQAAAIATSMAPAGRSPLSLAPSSAALAVAYTSALYANAWLSPTPADTDSVFSTMINNVSSGRFTIESALSTAETILSGLLQQ